MLNAPVISLTTLTPGGVTHVVSVHSDEASLFVITEDAFVTDAISPDAHIDEIDVEAKDETTSDVEAPSEFKDADFADLPRAALQLMAGHRALELMLKFQNGYLPFEAALNLDPDEPADTDNDLNDDDLNLDEGVTI